MAQPDDPAPTPAGCAEHRYSYPLFPDPHPRISAVDKDVADLIAFPMSQWKALRTTKWASRLQSPDLDVTVAPELSANAGETDKRFRVLKLGAAGSAMSSAPNRVVKYNQSYAGAAWLGGRVCANPHGFCGPVAARDSGGRGARSSFALAGETG